MPPQRGRGGISFLGAQVGRFGLLGLMGVLIADVVGILVACQICYYMFDGASYFN